MKKTIQTLIVAAFVVLTTATFGFAEYAAAGASNFPYFQLGALIVGGLIIISLKYKYQKMYTGKWSEPSPSTRCSWPCSHRPSSKPSKTWSARVG